MTDSNSTITRRNVLAGAAAIPVIVIPDVPMAAGNPDAALILLGHQLRRAWVFERSQENAGDAEIEKALDNTAAIADEIEQIEAKTIDGLRVKAMAVLWCHSGDYPIQLTDEPQAQDARLAQQIIHAILHM
jgi:hypothetical protein